MLMHTIYVHGVATFSILLSVPADTHHPDTHTHTQMYYTIAWFPNSNVCRCVRVVDFSSVFLPAQNINLTDRNMILLLEKSKFTVKWDALSCWWDVEEIIPERSSRTKYDIGLRHVINGGKNDEKCQKRNSSDYFFGIFFFFLFFPFLSAVRRHNFSAYFWMYSKKIIQLT